MIPDESAGVAQSGTHDIESFELANTRLKLREDLRFVLQENKSVTTHVVRDPVTSKVHEFGVTQYAFVSGLDGTSTLGQLAQRLANTMPHAAMSCHQAEQTARYLLDHQLAVALDTTGNRIESTDRLKQQRCELQTQRRAENANPLFVKVPLGNPAPWIDRLTPTFGWIFSQSGLIGIFCLMLSAALQLWNFSSDVTLSLRGFLDPASAVWLAAVFIGLKVVHELGHGIACHRFGGRVCEAGVVFILFIPIPYVDVTSAWCFQSRRQRMLVSAAGMLVEMAIASVAAIAWTMSVDPVTRFHLMNVMVAGTLTTLLFNANFLMRFDGYFLLSDAIAIPNLAPASRAFVGAYAKRLLLGTPLSLSQHDRGESLTLLAYGTAAMVWRVVVCIGLAVVASQMFFGFGLVLAIASLLTWFGRPSWKLFRQLLSSDVSSQHHRQYLLRRTLPMAIGTLALLCLVPWPWQASAPAIVRHRDAQVVRCETSGFLEQINAIDGQTVSAGEVIAVLRNERLEADIKMTSSRLSASNLRLRRELAEGNVASHQAERTLHQSLKTRLEELRNKQAGLELRAENNGKLVAPGLGDRIGMHCDEGFELCRIINPNRKELLVSISQKDRQSFGRAVGSNVRFLFSCIGEESVEFERVYPHAKRATDPRLTASGGGDLIQQQLDQEVILVEPRFDGIALLSSDQASRLFAGTKGSVRLDSPTQTVASRLLDYCTKFTLVIW